MEVAGRRIAGRSARLSESRTENPPVPFLCFSGTVFGCRNGIEKTGKQGKQGTTVRICKQCGWAPVCKNWQAGHRTLKDENDALCQFACWGSIPNPPLNLPSGELRPVGL